jgi:hypothetical protein
VSRNRKPAAVPPSIGLRVAAVRVGRGSLEDVLLRAMPLTVGVLLLLELVALLRASRAH